MEKVLSGSPVSGAAPGMSSGVRWGTRIAPLVTGLVPRLFRGGGPAAYDVARGLTIEHWTAVADGRHNLTTDLLWWRDRFYLVHSSSPWHIASADSRIVLWSSPDAHEWERLAEFSVPDGDIRDPKLAVIGDRLFLYVLRNDGFVAEPSGTAFSVSCDGRAWSPLRDCGPRGWLFWRPKSRGDGRWYVPAYWNKHGRSILLTSGDGERWDEIGEIHEGGHNDETDIEFLPDGRMIATARLEMSGNILGHDAACTWVGTAEPPYRRWTGVRCGTTRLDGPNLFSVGGQVFAAGRHHAKGGGFLDRRGGCFGKKRTSLYRVEAAGLTRLFDLPSAGDTSYPGVVVRGGEVTICYYTNDPSRDPSWLVGMFLPSEIRLARFGADDLLTVAARNKVALPVG